MADEFKNVFMNLLSKFYYFKDERSVSKFLFDNTYLVDLLFDLVQPLEKYFPWAQFRLSVYEEGVLKGTLLLRIYNDKTPDENDITLGILDNVWWAENIKRARGKLIVTA